MKFHKDLGLVSEVLRQDVVRKYEGDIGIGHVRYSTTGASVAENAQPLVLSYVKGTLALAHNGNLVNTPELKWELIQNGAIFHTTTDSEVIAFHIARERVHSKTVEEAVLKTAKKIKGAYGLVVMSPRKLIAINEICLVKRLSSSCNGLRLRFCCWVNAAIRPNSVCIPVAKATAVAVPAPTVVPA